MSKVTNAIPLELNCAHNYKMIPLKLYFVINYRVVSSTTIYLLEITMIPLRLFLVRNYKSVSSKTKMCPKLQNGFPLELHVAQSYNFCSI